MNFDELKKQTLNKMLFDDKSNKGSVDEPIKKLLKKINSLDNYYSTSSCSGRIIIIRIPKSGKKKEAEFIFRTHKKVTVKEVAKVVKNIDSTDAVWFRQEPAIIHVAARTLKDASVFLRIARRIGFKRSGIFEVEKRFLMELVSTERIDSIISKNGVVLVSDDYIKVLVQQANKHLEKTWDKISKLKNNLNLVT
ncbi:MAG: hypothetical protein KJ583_01765 [Nanoarchaeota archaeon]|nr:hypothetical protein [Nanoarchaeota archaeon]MBU1269718.1 hypothetical protein [Nanoarchaeota archaeon]MBU1604019.1 hypothetical protein [Nanoarchaeota archaeon]MBU2443592.1 hypothetical protein [Nanoarchaeota archaeon]